MSVEKISSVVQQLMMSQTNLMVLIHDFSQLGNTPTGSTKVKGSGI